MTPNTTLTLESNFSELVQTLFFSEIYEGSALFGRWDVKPGGW
jgi:hypothetical protein